MEIFLTTYISDLEYLPSIGVTQLTKSHKQFRHYRQMETLIIRLEAHARYLEERQELPA